MNSTALILLGGAMLGLLGLSVLCPLIAGVGYFFQRQSFKRTPSALRQRQGTPSRIEILIPAHNEAKHLGATLSSIQHSIEHFQKYNRFPAFEVRVGVDGCTDDTAFVARQYAGIALTEFPVNQGKWATITSLIKTSAADWVILVDAGAVWPEHWLTILVNEMNLYPEALAIAPAYSPRRGGLLSRVVWWVERRLKQLETWCGGPVSLHGATIGYAREPLMKTLAHLNDRTWLNDDVVIPLVLRMLHPAGVIRYPVGRMQDTAARTEELDWARRKRILVGNLQWTRALLPGCLRQNPVAGILAARRLFRIFWAYWVGLFILALAWAFPIFLVPAVIGVALSAMFSGSFRQLTGAAGVSLIAPFRIFHSQKWQLEGSWK
jgi:glycosyltransferase involved in cell wall biosynthesis